MEALTAVSVAALTIYDMVKAVDKTMAIGEHPPGREARRTVGRLQGRASSAITALKILVAIYSPVAAWNIPAEHVERLRREFPHHTFVHARTRSGGCSR